MIALLTVTMASPLQAESTPAPMAKAGAAPTEALPDLRLCAEMR